MQLRAEIAALREVAETVQVMTMGVSHLGLVEQMINEFA